MAEWLVSCAAVPHGITQNCVLVLMNRLSKQLPTCSVRQQWLECLEMAQIYQLIFVFVPGHTGTTANMRMGQLADSAIVDEGQRQQTEQTHEEQTTDRPDTINAIKEAG